MPATTQTGSVQGAVWTTAYVDSLPDSSFAYIDKDGGRHLPYKDKDGKVDLPHTRNALARLNQVKGLDGEERDKVCTKLQNALKNAKASDSDDMVLRTTNAIQASGADPAVLPDRVHLLRDGDFNTAKYGEIPIKAGDLYEMKFNFDRGVGMAHEGETGIPIDFAHQSNLNAAGWIRNLEVVQADDGGTELWGTNVEWSDSGKSALLGKEYKCLSSDFYPAAFGEWVDPESGITAKNVIVGAALTNRPMFTGNKPVIASDGEAEAIGVKTVIYVNATSEIKEKSMSLDQLRVKAAEDLSGAEYKFVVEHQDELTAEERAKFGLKAAAQTTEDGKQKEAEALKAAEEAKDKGVQADAIIAQQAEQIKALQASVEQLTGNQKAAEHAKIQKEVEAHAARGAIKPDMIETYVTAIEASDEPTRKALRTSLEALADNPLVGKTYGSKASEGSAEMDIEAEIGKKAKELLAAAEAKGEKIDIFTARQRVLAADPELAERSAVAAQAGFAAFRQSQGTVGADAAGLHGVNKG